MLFGCRATVQGASSRAFAKAGASHSLCVAASSALQQQLVASEHPMKLNVELKDRCITHVQVHTSVEAPPNLVFDILADPANHPSVFSSIKEAKHKLLEDNGPQKTWALQYKTAWKFWKVGGVCDTHCTMWTDKDKGTVSFRLSEPGILKVYEGTWTIQPGGLPARQPSRSTSSSASLSSLDSSTSSASTTSGSSVSHVVTPRAGGSADGDSSNGVPSSRLATHPPPAASVSLQGADLASHPLSGMEYSWLGDTASAAAARVAPLTGWVAQLGVGSSGFPAPGWLGSGSGSGSGSAPPALVPPPEPEPAPFTILTVDKMMAPKIQPPYPLNLALKGNAAGQIREMVESLAAVAVARTQQQEGGEGRGGGGPAAAS